MVSITIGTPLERSSLVEHRLGLFDRVSAEHPSAVAYGRGRVLSLDPRPVSLPA